MKKQLQNIGTMVLALLVLFSSLSFGISKHYCAGEVSEVSYFVVAEGCEMPEVNPVCETSTTPVVEKKSCCENKYQFVDGNDFPSKKIASLVSYGFPVAVIQHWKISFSLLEEKFDLHSFFQYHSPPIQKDRVVVYESYLI